MLRFTDMKGDAQEIKNHMVLWIPLTVTLGPLDRRKYIRISCWSGYQSGLWIPGSVRSEADPARPHLKNVPLALSGLCGHGGMSSSRAWVPAVQLNQREDHGLEPTEKKTVGSVPQKKWLPEMTTTVWHLKQTDQRWYKNSWKWLLTFQFMSHLTSIVWGLDLLSLFLLLSGVSYWIESNLDIVSLHGVLQPKRDWWKAGVWGQWFQHSFPQSSTNDKAVTWENNSCKSDFIVSDGEGWT